jgi:hypothetical protein
LSILENGGDLEGQKLSGTKLKILMAEFMIITVDTGKVVCNTSKRHYRISIVNMLKEFQPGLSQGIYEALAGRINCTVVGCTK